MKYFHFTYHPSASEFIENYNTCQEIIEKVLEEYCSQWCWTEEKDSHWHIAGECNYKSDQRDSEWFNDKIKQGGWPKHVSQIHKRFQVGKEDKKHNFIKLVGYTLKDLLESGELDYDQIIAGNGPEKLMSLQMDKVTFEHAIQSANINARSETPLTLCKYVDEIISHYKLIGVRLEKEHYAPSINTYGACITFNANILPVLEIMSNEGYVTTAKPDSICWQLYQKIRRSDVPEVTY